MNIWPTYWSLKYYKLTFSDEVELHVSALSIGPECRHHRRHSAREVAVVRADAQCSHVLEEGGWGVRFLSCPNTETIMCCICCSYHSLQRLHVEESAHDGWIDRPSDPHEQIVTVLQEEHTCPKKSG